MLGKFLGRSILFLVLGTLAVPSLAQSISGRSIVELREEAADTSFQVETAYRGASFPGIYHPKPTNAYARRDGPVGNSRVPPDLVYRSFGFFCKIEADLGRSMALPVKFRLGEVQYVERMEGKKGYWPY